MLFDILFQKITSEYEIMVIFHEKILVDAIFTQLII